MSGDEGEDYGAHEEIERDGEGKPENSEGLFLEIKEWVSRDIDHSRTWRAAARDEFSFVAGPGQWDAKDVSTLRDQKRPVVTFNKTLKFIRAVCGLEVNNRQMTSYLPRDVTNPGEVAANELLTSASDWMDQSCKAGRQQSRAFRDTVICGMGWTEQGLDYDEDPAGRYVETRCNPLEMGWDCNARDANLQDSKRRWRVRKMRVAEARSLVETMTSEKFADEDLDASWCEDIATPYGETVKTQREKELREETYAGDTGKGDVNLLQIQWIEHEVYVRTVDPSTNQHADMSRDDFERANQQFMMVTGQSLPKAMLRRKIYKQAFVGSRVLAVGPAPRGNGFVWNCITGEPDDNDGTWFGFVRVLRDPQTWTNKFFAQLMHIINATAKGGILAEEDVFPDVRAAQDTYAKPDAITTVAKGAISKGKIMAKPGAGMTAGILNLLQISDQMFGETSGLNMELMGLADRQQPGVLEAQRKQAAMTILASLFDSLSSFRQDVGKGRLWFIQKYLADGRMIRVHGEDGQKAVPLLRDMTLGDYDVIIDDAPTSVNMKEKAWMGLQTLLPAIQDMLTPEVVVMLLDYVPGLPAKLVESLKAIASKGPDPAEAEAAQRAANAEIENKEADTAKKKSGAILDLARAGREQAQKQAAEVERMTAGRRPPLAVVADDPQPYRVQPQPARGPMADLEDWGILESGGGAMDSGGVQPPGGLRGLN